MAISRYFFPLRQVCGTQQVLFPTEAMYRPYKPNNVLCFPEQLSREQESREQEACWPKVLR